MAGPILRGAAGGEHGPIVFITHAHEDRRRAVGVKSTLRLLGFTGFVAHQDIEGGLQWEEEILRNLRACVALVVLLTPEARESFWVNQEIGIAVGTDRPVRSVGRDLAPWGFLSRWQSSPWMEPAGPDQQFVRAAREGNVAELYGLLSRAGVASRRRLIEGLGNTHEFDEARAVVLLLSTLGGLDPDEATRLVEVTKGSSDVLGCFKAHELLPALIRPHKGMLDPGSLAILDASGIQV